ncbi:MAG: leucine-rich repeat domain-containing protein [Lachnospiraceae bacterium]|nr:leucine-rich repeat domain-containing protein [Lachnospiraceae bacterium]
MIDIMDEKKIKGYIARMGFLGYDIEYHRNGFYTLKRVDWKIIATDGKLPIDDSISDLPCLKLKNIDQVAAGALDEVLFHTNGQLCLHFELPEEDIRWFYEDVVYLPDFCISLNGTFKNSSVLKKIHIVAPHACPLDLTESFFHCENLEYAEISESAVLFGVDSMFEGCRSLESVELIVECAETAENVFKDCVRLKKVFLAIYDNLDCVMNSKCRSLLGLFQNCFSLEDIDLNHLSGTLEYVGNFSRMFEGCQSLKKVSFPQTEVLSGNLNLSNMFAFCNSLEELDMQWFDIDNIPPAYKKDWLLGCKSLNEDRIKKYL